MKTADDLMQEIIKITTYIEVNYPELYKYIGESPINNAQSKKVNSENLADYLETLQSQLQHHIESHKK